MILIAILFPGLSFLLRGKIMSAIMAIILQVIAVFFFLVFGIGALLWVILAIWAVASYNEAKREKRHRQMLKILEHEKAK
ncbi:MAG: YqaE/Pmp3 family membrane protein [Chitinophagaceae bacterium]|nr:MAG: YqaE/Pmp3 family membrane protein [Chitinophagaceae bacterium]